MWIFTDFKKFLNATKIYSNIRYIYAYVYRAIHVLLTNSHDDSDNGVNSENDI